MRIYGIGLPDNVLRKVYYANAEVPAGGPRYSGTAACGTTLALRLNESRREGDSIVPFAAVVSQRGVVAGRLAQL